MMITGKLSLRKRKISRIPNKKAVAGDEEINNKSVVELWLSLNVSKEKAVDYWNAISMATNLSSF